MGRFWGNSVQKIFGELLGSYSGLMKGLVTIEGSYSVYMHTFPNEKVYVGITKNDPIIRWGKNGSGYHKQPVYSAIMEFGWDNIKHEIIKDNLPVEIAVKIEKELISKYRSLDRCYNSSRGGETCESMDYLYKYKERFYTLDELLKISNVDGLTSLDIINRINNHGWTVERAITQDIQERTRFYVYNGKMYKLGELYNMRINKDISYSTLASRLHRGWDVKNALTLPINENSNKRYNYNGDFYDRYQLAELSSIKGITPSTIAARINKGMSVEEAISRPLPRKSRHRYQNTKNNNNKKRKCRYNGHRKYSYNGKKYSSGELLDICKDKNMTKSCILKRWKLGWTSWEIVNIPKGVNRKEFYKNEIKITHYANQQPSQSNLGKSRLEGPETNS